MSDDLRARMHAFQVGLEARDGDALAAILDEDYVLVLVHPGRALMPRTVWLEVLADYFIHSYEVEEQVIDVDGDCATVLHRVTMSATVRGQDRSGVFIISDVWRLRDGGWRLWRRHSTPVSGARLPGA